MTSPIFSASLIDQAGIKPRGTLDYAAIARLLSLIEARFLPLENQSISLDEAIEAMRGVALDRINNVVGPAVQWLLDIQSRGFLIAHSASSGELIDGNVLTLVVSDEAERAMFTPSPFCALTRTANADDYGIARTISYDRETGAYVGSLVAAYGSAGPHADWVIGAVAGSTMASVIVLDEVRSIRDAVLPARNQAVNAATAALERKDAAEQARDKSAEWAGKPVDTEVEPGKFSALHHAEKARGYAQAAETFDPAAYFLKGETFSRTETGAEIATAISAYSGTVTSALAGKLDLAQIGATPSQRANMMLNAFNIAMVGAMARQAAVDGFYDTFTDATGIDGTSSGISHNAERGRYETSGITASTANYGGSGDRRAFITVSSDLTYSGTLNSLVDGSTSGTVSASDTNVAGKSIAFDFGRPVMISQIQAAQPTAIARGTWKIQRSHDGVNWTDTSGDINWSANTSAAFNLGVAAGFYRRYRLLGVSGTFNSGAIGEFTFNAFAAPNATLLSTPQTASAQPTIASFYALKEDYLNSVAPVLNTDFIAEVSRNNGTTWTAVPLAVVSTLGSEALLAGDVSIAGQPAGTTMRWRIRTIGKFVGVSAAGMSWR